VSSNAELVQRGGDIAGTDRELDDRGVVGQLGRVLVDELVAADVLKHEAHVVRL
jgi:hypothetical protein